MFHKEKNKNKKWFCRNCLHCFSNKNMLVKHKENCLNIIGNQPVKLEKRIITFENYFQQILVPFEAHSFRKGNNCLICKKFINNGEEKVRNHSNVTGKFRGAAHESFNSNLQLTK